MAADWSALRVEYVNGTMALRELAKSHDVKPPTLMNHASREKWESERKQMRANACKKANESLGEERVAILTLFNAQDVKNAEALKAKATRILDGNGAVSVSELASLARIFETAQKIGRLALGATTESSSVTTAPSGLGHFYPNSKTETLN